MLSNLLSLNYLVLAAEVIVVYFALLQATAVSVCTWLDLKHNGRHTYIHLFLCILPEALPHSFTLLTPNAMQHKEHVTAVASSDGP